MNHLILISIEITKYSYQNVHLALGSKFLLQDLYVSLNKIRFQLTSSLTPYRLCPLLQPDLRTLHMHVYKPLNFVTV